MHVCVHVYHQRLHVYESIVNIMQIPCGFDNLANNCFANCIWQCLLNNREYLLLFNDLCKAHEDGQLCDSQDQCNVNDDSK